MYFSTDIFLLQVSHIFTFLSVNIRECDAIFVIMFQILLSRKARLLLPKLKRTRVRNQVLLYVFPNQHLLLIHHPDCQLRIQTVLLYHIPTDTKDVIPEIHLSICACLWRLEVQIFVVTTIETAILVMDIHALRRWILDILEIRPPTLTS